MVSITVVSSVDDIPTEFASLACTCLTHMLAREYTGRVRFRDRGWKQKTLNNDFYHTTSRRAAIFGVQIVLSYLVLALTLWIGIWPTKRRRGVWNFGEVSVTYCRSFGNHTLAGALCSGNIIPQTALVSQQFRCFIGHSLILFQYLAVHFNWCIVWHILTSMSSCKSLKSVLIIDIHAKSMTFWAYCNR